MTKQSMMVFRMIHANDSRSYQEVRFLCGQLGLPGNHVGKYAVPMDPEGRFWGGDVGTPREFTAQMVVV